MLRNLRQLKNRTQAGMPGRNACAAQLFGSRKLYGPTQANQGELRQKGVEEVFVFEETPESTGAEDHGLILGEMFRRDETG